MVAVVGNAVLSANDFTEAEIRLMLDNLDAYEPEEQAEIEKIADIIESRKTAKACFDDLIEFCKHMQADYKVGKHHRRLANLLMDIAVGNKDRVCVNMPPRHGKSQLVSIYYPAWFLGKYPTKKVLMVSHTTDLAVDFGRKVRNIIDSEAYKLIFPNVGLAADSKSAGRWSTNAGGEYFACLTPTTLVSTPRGYIPAGQVCIGDTLYNAGSGVMVQEIYHSQHPDTYSIRGLQCSENHPIWTMNRGWVYAKDVHPDDVLTVESISDSMKVLIRRAHAYLEYTPVSTLVQHQVALHKPQQREVGSLWGARDYILRTVAHIQEFCFRYGGATVATAHSGSGGQRRPLQPRELPMGRRTATAEQQTHQRQDWQQDASGTCTGTGGHPHSNSLPDETRTRPAGEGEATQEELQTYSPPKNLGWARRNAARVIAASSGSVQCAGRSPEGYMACVGETAQKLYGFLLGVRRAGVIQVHTHAPEPFVNFLTDGDHTFFADGVLTHNCGVGSALAGRGADLLLVDDPHNEQDIINGNYDVFDRAYEWFTYGARTRLMPGGRVAIVQCMTGDTPVRMADGTEKPLRDIYTGDLVATHNWGALASSVVLNHKSNGIDSVYTIKTTCGKMVKANKRHPFLVHNQGGELQWIRLKNLKPGDFLVSLRDVPAPERQKQNQASVTHVGQKRHGTANTLMHRFAQLGIGANILARRAVLRVALGLHKLVKCVSPTTTRIIGPQAMDDVVQVKTEKPTSSTGMGSRCRHMMHSSLYKMESVLFASNPLQTRIPALIGTTSCVLTTATAQKKSGGSCAMIATSQLGTPKPQPSPLQLLNTCNFTTTQIASIEYAGEEEVFDIQVAQTENFIANGLVSHNTRWHQNDLSGRVTRDMKANAGADQYEVIEFPAIVDTDQPDGTIVQKPLWPEFFDMTALLRTKASMPTFQWNAQYQQNPTAEEASVVKRDWWKLWEKEDPPKCEYVIMSLDAAAESHNRADFTALTTWGVFMNDAEGCHNIILLNSIKKRLEFPELKELAYAEYKEWEPDAFIVEKKSAGTQLYQEMRRTGIPVGEFTPHRGSGDKLARLNSVADIVRSGLCWVPDTRWAEEVVEEIAGFPFMSNDDLVDSTVMALMRFRQGGFIRLPSDEPDDIRYFKARKGGYY